MWSRWEWNIYLLSYDILWKFPLVIEMLMILKIWKWKSEEKEGLGDRHKKAFDLPSSEAQGVPCWKSPPIGFVPVSSQSPGCVTLQVILMLIMLILKSHMSRVFCWCHMWKIISGCANSPTCAAVLSYFHINLTHLISLTQAFYAQTM